jgi:copper chaperone
MITLKFKSSFKCNGCVNSVRTQLDAIPSIKEWNVDLESTDRVLTLSCEEDITAQIKSIVENAGHTISKIEG